VNTVVVDYGAGNTRSVRAALRRLGVETTLTSEPSAVASADWVILPGVGSAKSAMAQLHATGAVTALRERFAAGGPLLGICLGLQLAMTTSEEDGGIDTLHFVDGVTRKIPSGRVPRLGWSIVEPTGEAYYFAHSYYADTLAATATADGLTAEVRVGAFVGAQFHPEKSGAAGLEFLTQCRSLV
jgi:glutamine amidotransferase